MLLFFIILFINDLQIFQKKIVVFLKNNNKFNCLTNSQTLVIQ